MSAIGRQTAENTRSIILDLIRSSTTISRIELVEKSGMTGTTITRVVKGLIDDGLVVETGFGSSTGGKRPTLLELNVRSRYAIGLSVDESCLTYVVVDLRGNLVGRSVSDGVGDWLHESIIERIGTEVAALLSQLNIDIQSVVGLGVASAGSFDLEHHTLRLSRTVDAALDFPVQGALERRTGLAVTLENDSTCAALAEFWIGRIPATRNFATIYMATGIGCGFIVEGAIFRGSSANAGTIAHTVIDLNGPRCWCGADGCLEMLASPSVVVRRAMNMPQLPRELSLDGDAERVRGDFAVIARAAAGGEQRCLQLIEESARYLAIAVVSMINLLDLNQIYLAGPAFTDAGAIYLRSLRERAQQVAFMRSVVPVSVELSAIGSDSAAVGAAVLVLQRHLTPHRFTEAAAIVQAG
jgi:predicted NBD/HSP70 family sugar kinase